MGCCTVPCADEQQGVLDGLDDVDALDPRRLLAAEQEDLAHEIAGPQRGSLEATALGIPWALDGRVVTHLGVCPQSTG